MLDMRILYLVFLLSVSSNAKFLTTHGFEEIGFHTSEDANITICNFGKFLKNGTMGCFSEIYEITTSGNTEEFTNVKLPKSYLSSFIMAIAVLVAPDANILVIVDYNDEFGTQTSFEVMRQFPRRYPQLFTNRVNNMTTTIRYRTVCEPTYYGESCDKICHKDLPNVLMCPDTGIAECIEGYSGADCDIRDGSSSSSFILPFLLGITLMILLFIAFYSFELYLLKDYDVYFTHRTTKVCQKCDVRENVSYFFRNIYSKVFNRHKTVQVV